MDRLSVTRAQGVTSLVMRARILGTLLMPSEPSIYNTFSSYPLVTDAEIYFGLSPTSFMGE